MSLPQVLAKGQAFLVSFLVSPDTRSIAWVIGCDPGLGVFRLPMQWLAAKCIGHHYTRRVGNICTTIAMYNL